MWFSVSPKRYVLEVSRIVILQVLAIASMRIELQVIYIHTVKAKPKNNSAYTHTLSKARSIENGRWKHYRRYGLLLFMYSILSTANYKKIERSHRNVKSNSM